MNIRDKLIAAGVKNLREFGYPSCDDKNILTDMVYSRFFVSMLKDNKGRAGAEVDSVIDALLKELGEGLLPKTTKTGKSKKGKS
jgi:hypothetical protein